MPPPATDRRRAELVQAVGTVAMSRGEYAVAKIKFEEARELFKTMHEARGEADSVKLLGELALAVGDSKAALALYRDAREKYLALDEETLADECREKADIARAKETPASTGEELFMANLKMIDQTIAFVARRYHLSSTSSEEFASVVHLKLIQNDYEVLRRFRSQSSFRSYISAVVQHLCLDYRTAQWGKWRPSAEARRLGPQAELLERLITRDGHTHDEAISLVNANHMSQGDSVSEQELRALIERLPLKPSRQFIDESSLRGLPASDDPDLESQAEDRSARDRELVKVLGDIIATLDSDDQTFLRMRFEDNMTTAQMARKLLKDQRSVYQRFKYLMQLMRTKFEERGISEVDIIDMFEHIG
jgi:RNA polymerase sigma factor (sigma-70 family)